ncbi:MAG TPA: DALR domain-containing protein, partial [Nitrospiraceae bacterium]|nr:DALR domain-containing protein [Nitrospiraceae bacterium]
DDDINTSVVIAELQRLKTDTNKFMGQGLSTEARKLARVEFRSLGNTLGLFQLDKWQFGESLPPGRFNETTSSFRGSGEESGSSVWGPPTKNSINDEEIDRKLIERNEARKQKDFKKADEIRQFLASHGIVIEDKPDGTSRWKR